MCGRKRFRVALETSMATFVWLIVAYVALETSVATVVWLNVAYVALETSVATVVWLNVAYVWLNLNGNVRVAYRRICCS